MERPRYIAVEGPIGVGKSTLCALLAERLGGRLVLEPADENPFLPGFYADRKKHAFQAQLFFLLSRFAQQQELLQQDLFSQATVADYLFSKDRIFAALNLGPAELVLYERVYELLGPRVVKPDLVVYLQARTDVLLERIRKRGFPPEKPIKAEYVEEVARAYADFFFNYNEGPLLIVNASDIDFVGDLQHRAELIEVIKRTRSGTSHWSRG